jgi:cation diffusion facilitator family transporter
MSAPAPMPLDHSSPMPLSAGDPAASQRLRRWAAAGLLLNLTLAAGKLAAGIVGSSYALIADAVESLVDILGSAIIWSGLLYSARPPDAKHPFGHGKAEALAALAVALILMGAGLAIAVEAIREIITPHHAPAWWTLLVLTGVVAAKETMFRLVRRVARREGSTAVEVDAWHHRADAVTSLLAFAGISAALLGGPGWEPADDFAALAASGIILFNAAKLARQPLNELLDAHAEEIVQPATLIARAVPGVVDIEKVRARRSGTRYFLDMHVEVDPQLPVALGHAIGGKVRAAVRTQLPRVADVLIHIEPARPPTAAPTTSAPGPRDTLRA